MSSAARGPAGDKPVWLRVRVRMTPAFEAVQRTVSENRLHTVCHSAACPNLGECWARGTATFMIGGNLCTRRCGFCDVPTGRPAPLDEDEPERVAKAVEQLCLGFAPFAHENVHATGNAANPTRPEIPQSNRYACLPGQLLRRIQAQARTSGIALQGAGPSQGQGRH